MSRARQGRKQLGAITQVTRSVYALGRHLADDHWQTSTGDEWMFGTEIRTVAKRLKLPAPDPLPYNMTLTEVIKHFRQEFFRMHPEL